MLFPLHHQIPLHWHNYKPPPVSIYFHDMILSWEVFCTGFHDPGSGCPSSWPWKKEGGLTQPQVPAQLFTKFQPTPPPPMPPLPLHLHLIFTGYRKKNTLGKAANDDPYASIKIEQILKKVILHVSFIHCQKFRSLHFSLYNLFSKN